MAEGTEITDRSGGPRQPYQSPKLTTFGDMKALTAGGSNPTEEGFPDPDASAEP